MAFFIKMKQSLSAGGGLSCSSAASTSVVDRRCHSPHLRDAHRSSSSMKKKNNKKKPTSPASSSRFLLNSSRLQQQSDLDALPPPPPSFIEQDLFVRPVIGITEQTATNKDDDDDDGISKAAAMMTTTRSCSTRSQHQVVVLKVSLHCKGCAGKVKKHISKMEGVTSFDIDIATKKVTVMGDVTPLGVLNCISKVKSAQFWPASTSSPPRASSSF